MKTLKPATPQMTPVHCYPKQDLYTVTPNRTCTLLPQTGRVHCYPKQDLYTVTPNRTCALSPQTGLVNCHPKQDLYIGCNWTVQYLKLIMNVVR